MKSAFQAILMLGLVMPAFSATPEIDFDGKSKSGTNVVEYINGSDVSSALITKETSPIVTTSMGVASRRLVEIKGSGEERIIQPIATADGKGVYEFMPNADLSWEFSCTGQTTGQWGVCWSTEFNPAAAGHNHSPTGTLSYIDPYSTATPPALLPKEICKYSQVNTPIKIYYKAPLYSTSVFDKASYSGKCTGSANDNVSIKVTAQNLIQLTELKAEPYFIFKEPGTDEQKHPAYHYGTPDTIAKFKQIAWEYNQQFSASATNSKLIVNDMGLIWGGRYNYDSPWNCWVDGQHHFFHRYGRQMDIHTRSMSAEQRSCLVEIACKYQVRPQFEGKAIDSLLGHDYSRFSSSELDELERVIHYHLNFARPTDMVVTPPDDDRDATCPDPALAEKSACPKQLGIIPFK